MSELSDWLDERRNRRYSIKFLPGMFLFAYVGKNTDRSGRQNNNANYDWVDVIGTERPGKKGIAYMLRNSLKNGHFKLHNYYLKAIEDKPFQFFRTPWSA